MHGSKSHDNIMQSKWRLLRRAQISNIARQCLIKVDSLSAQATELSSHKQDADCSVLGACRISSKPPRISYTLWKYLSGLNSNQYFLEDCTPQRQASEDWQIMFSSHCYVLLRCYTFNTQHVRLQQHQTRCSNQQAQCFKGMAARVVTT